MKRFQSAAVQRLTDSCVLFEIGNRKEMKLQQTVKLHQLKRFGCLVYTSVRNAAPTAGYTGRMQFADEKTVNISAMFSVPSPKVTSSPLGLVRVSSMFTVRRVTTRCSLDGKTPPSTVQRVSGASVNNPSSPPFLPRRTGPK